MPLTARIRPRLKLLERRDAPAIVPIGPEFQVGADGFRSRIATDAQGDFVIAYDGAAGIAAQRFDQFGVPQGQPIFVGSGYQPGIAMESNGDFVVAWIRNGDMAIDARRFDANGTPLGSPFAVSTFQPSRFYFLAASMDQAGNFVVCWSQLEAGQQKSYARTYNEAGTAITQPFLIHSNASGLVNYGVAMDADGDFVATWQNPGIWARRFHLNGVPYGEQFQVAKNGIGPNIGMTPAGDFVICWSGGEIQVGDVYAQRYSSDGQSLGGSFLVNTYTPGDQGNYLEVRRDAAGNFLVAWEDRSGQDGSGYGIYARTFTSDGGPDGDEFRVHTTTAGNQSRPAVGMNQDGDAVISWANAQAGVFAQRFRRVVPPQVQSVQVNDGSRQRSRVTSLTVTFSTIVEFEGAIANAFTLTRNGGKSVTFTATASNTTGVTVVSLTGLTGGSTQFGSLADGRYTLNALATQITDDFGQHLDGDGDGQPGGNYTFGETQGLFRFFGDINGDRRVDIADYGLLSLSYLNQGNYVAAFDFNGDGRIDIADYGQFGLRYLSSLP